MLCVADGVSNSSIARAAVAMKVGGVGRSRGRYVTLAPVHIGDEYILRRSYTIQQMHMSNTYILFCWKKANKDIVDNKNCSIVIFQLEFLSISI